MRRGQLISKSVPFYEAAWTRVQYLAAIFPDSLCCALDIGECDSTS